MSSVEVQPGVVLFETCKARSILTSLAALLCFLLFAITFLRSDLYSNLEKYRSTFIRLLYN